LKGWIQKETAAANTHSLWVKGWFEAFIKWVPCVIELGNAHDLKEGMVWIRFNPPEPKPGFKLQVPISKVMYEPRLYLHWAPLSCRPLMQDLLDTIITVERGMAT